MADNADKNSPEGGAELNVEDDVRLRYMGFDVGPTKVGELFKSGKEQDGFVEHVREKRQSDDVLRDTSNFREERISGAEKYVLLVAAFAVLLFFFLPMTPWISGHFETRTEVPINPVKQAAPVEVVSSDSALVDSGSVDTTNLAGATTDDEFDAVPAATPQKSGFQDLQTNRTRTKIDKTPFNLSGLQVVTHFGSVSSDVFSSGIILMITGVLFAIYILMIFAIPIFIIYSVLTIKGEADEVALKLKKALRFGWYPVMLWSLMLFLSIIGAEYGFDSSEALKQVGETYGAATFLGLLGAGFYISLAGCIFAGAKSVEI